MSRSYLLTLVASVLLLNFISCAPPVQPASQDAAASTLPAAIKDDKLNELKVHLQNSQSTENALPAIVKKASKLEDVPAPADASSAPADSGDSADGDDTASKANFWKHMIGGGGASMMGGGDEHPPSSMPTMVYLLPVVGFIGVGFAILAYCAFGT